MKHAGLPVALIAFLAGCGWGGQAADGSKPRVEPAPRIEGVDKAAPEKIRRWVEFDFRASKSGPDSTWEIDPVEVIEGGKCVTVIDGSSDETACTPEGIERLDEKLEQRLEPFRPAADSEPRIVAQLALPAGAPIELIVWRTATAKLCLAANRPAAGVLAIPAGPIGECAREATPRCPQLCIGLSDDGRNVLYGVVSPKAESLAVELEDGGVLEYPLTGPLVPGFEARAFLADLGTRRYRKLELRRREEVVTDAARDDQELRLEDCSRRFDDNDAGFQTCLDETGVPPTTE